NLRRAHLPARLRQRQAAFNHQFAADDVIVRHQRPQPDMIAMPGDPIKPWHTGDAGQHLNTGPRLTSELDPTLRPAGDHPRPFTMLGQQFESFGYRGRAVVVLPHGSITFDHNSMVSAFANFVRKRLLLVNLKKLDDFFVWPDKERNRDLQAVTQRRILRFDGDLAASLTHTLNRRV